MAHAASAGDTAPAGDTARSSEALVSLHGVQKWFGDLHVLKDIDLDIHRGEVVVVIGPSGSGKSTLCRAINRLEPIDEGEIRLDGKALPEEGKELANLRAEVGMVFQSFNLFAHKTVLDNVMLGPLKVRKRNSAECKEQALALLERVGVTAQATIDEALLDDIDIAVLLTAHRDVDYTAVLRGAARTFDSTGYLRGHDEAIRAGRLMLL